ncbi:MAG: DoxX family protein [Bacteroidota bacterium]
MSAILVLEKWPLDLFVMAILYFVAGLAHFLRPQFYLAIMPPRLPNHKAVNWIAGAAEIVLALGLLVEPIRPYAAFGVILLLIAVFPANIYHLQSRGAGMKVPIWILWVRLPIQGLLIWWAWQYI